jgi:hypothetical protein
MVSLVLFSSGLLNNWAFSFVSVADMYQLYHNEHLELNRSEAVGKQATIKKS